MDEESESPPASTDKPSFSVLVPSKAFLCSRKGQLLTAEVVLSFITFICFTASNAVAFMTAPLIEFLFAFFLFFAYSTKVNEKFKGVLWPLLDFLRCVSGAIIFFAISIVAVSGSYNGAAKAAGLFGFIATIVFALDFYFIFNDLANFLKKNDDSDEPEANQSAGDDSGSDSD